MSKKSFFLPQFFSPNTAKIFSKFCKQSGDIVFNMYADNEIIEYDLPGYNLFLPRSVLNKNYRFGKIQGDKKRVILQLHLDEQSLQNLIHMLGGTITKKVKPPSNPTLGDILKI